jgi:hypothetical protein
LTSPMNSRTEQNREEKHWHVLDQPLQQGTQHCAWLLNF